MKIRFLAPFLASCFLAQSAAAFTLLETDVNTPEICETTCAMYGDLGQWFVYVPVREDIEATFWTHIANSSGTATPSKETQKACMESARVACQWANDPSYIPDLQQNFPDFHGCSALKMNVTRQDTWGRPNALMFPATVACR